ncbi:MAG: hypothetical protein ACKO7V_06405, partial [Bacteroidota bacterium]
MNKPIQPYRPTLNTQCRMLGMGLLWSLVVPLAMAQQGKAKQASPQILAKIPAEPGTRVVLATVRLHQSDTVAVAQT